VFARFYTLSGDAQATTRCVVPARVLPAEVVLLGQVELRKGRPSVWQNPVTQHLFDLVRDKQECENRIVIDVDDPYHHMHEGWKQKDVDSHIDALAHADVVICTTDALAEAYEGLHADIRVIPSCVDLTDFQFGRQMQHLDGKVRIGYAAGYTHAPDAEIIGDALAQISEHPDVIVEFVGAFDPGWDFKYNRYPALPYAAYKAMIATWSIGLAPLVDNDINRTRSDLKALDYGMSFANPVVSPIGPYQHLADAGLVAYAETTQEWYDAILGLVENGEQAGRLAMKFFNYCRIERHPANQRVAYLDALGLRRSYAHV
jgi:hypothetical protein